MSKFSEALHPRGRGGKFAKKGSGGKSAPSKAVPSGNGGAKKGTRSTQRKYDKAVFNRSNAQNRRRSVKDNARYGAGNTKGQIRRGERKNVRMEKRATRLENSIKGKTLRKGNDKQAAYDRHFNKVYRRSQARRAVAGAVRAGVSSR